MAKYEIRVRYAFEDTYMVAVGGREEAKRVIEEDRGLALGGSTHTTHDDDEVTNQNFGVHPESQILSIRETGRKARVKYTATDLSGRVEELRNDIIETIRQLLRVHSLVELAFTNWEDDPVWIIQFRRNGDPCEYRVTGVRIMEDNLTVVAEEKENSNEVECYGPLKLGVKNINWLHGMYNAA